MVSILTSKYNGYFHDKHDWKHYVPPYYVRGGKKYLIIDLILILRLFLTADRLRKLEASVVDIAVEAKLDKLAVAVCTESRMITDVRIIGTKNLFILVFVPVIKHLSFSLKCGTSTPYWCMHIV